MRGISKPSEEPMEEVRRYRPIAELTTSIAPVEAERAEEN